MFLNRKTGVLVQGITGREGAFWTERMQACGTRVLAGVTPGKGGEKVDSITVCDTVEEFATWHSVSFRFHPPCCIVGVGLKFLGLGCDTSDVQNTSS